MCAENQIRSSVRTTRLQPKRSTPKKAKLPTKDREILQGAKQPSDADKSQTIVSLSSQIMIPTVCGLCLLSIVVLKILRPDAEVYSFLCVFVVLLFKSFSK
jgi:hypothetical protein